jgi:hypothetical protein
MLGGAARSGMEMADKISTEKRANKKQEGLLQKRNAREDQQILDRNTREDKQIKDSNAFTLSRDELSHKQAMTLAYVNKKSSAKSPWSVQKLKDENGAEKLVRFNSSTGEQLEVKSESKPDLLGTPLNIRNKVKTAADKETELMQKAEAKREQQEARSESRADSLLPPSNEPGYDVQRANLVKLIKKQDRGEYLSLEENGILLQLDEERAAREAEEKEIQGTHSVNKSNGSVLSDHKNITSRFLNQNRERYAN